MKGKSKPFILITVLAIPILLVSLWAWMLGTDQLFLIQRYWNKSEPINFYGRVVDQQNQPIPGATVIVLIQGFNSQSLTGSKDYMSDERTVITTGSNGEFMVKATGIILFVESIAHPAYLKVPERKWDSMFVVNGFRYSKEPGVPYYTPDPQKPAIFPLRKEGEERILWPSRGGKDEPNTSSLPATKRST